MPTGGVLEMTENGSSQLGMSRNLDPSDIFGSVVMSSAFEPRSASIEEKRRIFEKFWNEDADWLLRSFDSYGKDPATDGFGFGFLVEGFARHSKKLPDHNTSKGEEASRAILSSLHSGRDGMVNLGRSRSNSDFLWVKYRGRRITVTGIGEVKASYDAARDKIGGQLQRQVDSIQFLIQKLKEAKNSGAIHDFFKKRTVVLVDDMKKVLIVPFGEGEKVRLDEKFSDWQVVELEFSYNELTFIAKQIWPGFRPDVRFIPGRLANVDKMAINLGEWMKPRFDDVFSDSAEFDADNPLPYFLLGLFALATDKIPLMEEEVKLSAHWVEESYWPAIQKSLNSLANSGLPPEKDFSKQEQEMRRRFLHILTSNREDLDSFICFIRSLRKQIKETARSEKRTAAFRDMKEYNALSV